VCICAYMYVPMHVRMRACIRISVRHVYSMLDSRIKGTEMQPDSLFLEDYYVPVLPQIKPKIAYIYIYIYIYKI
jgi:hypothetical protein